MKRHLYVTTNILQLRTYFSARTSVLMKYCITKAKIQGITERYKDSSTNDLTDTNFLQHSGTPKLPLENAFFPLVTRTGLKRTVDPPALLVVALLPPQGKPGRGAVL